MLVFAGILIAASSQPPLVVLDPGHGGEEHGAVGVCGVVEKEVTLAVATELAKLLDASDEARVHLTRQSDQNIDLVKRAELANRAGASLFVSIHANASTRAATHGVETFFLSRRSSDRRIRALAKRENGDHPIPELGERSDLERILHGLSLNASHGESQRLAAMLQRNMEGSLSSRSRGVLQAPFVVLAEASMASALVEIGFLTNPVECQKLATTAYQRRVARVLAAAILHHVAQERAVALAPAP